MAEDEDMPMFDLEPPNAAVQYYEQLPDLFPPPPRGASTTFSPDDGFALQAGVITPQFLTKLLYLTTQNTTTWYTSFVFKSWCRETIGLDIDEARYNPTPSHNPHTALQMLRGWASQKL